MALDRRGSTPDISRYNGFRGSWDKDINAFVFASKEERDKFQVATYGAVRNGFREPDEPEDERQGIARDRCQCKGCREHEGFWRNEAERHAFERAVETCPPMESKQLDLFVYLGEVGRVATGIMPEVSKMPRARQSRQQQDRQLARLRAQARGLGEGIEDYA